jgi:DUF917 family protein
MTAEARNSVKPGSRDTHYAGPARIPSLAIRTASEAEDLIRGLTLLGTGGGGRPDLGRRYLLDHIQAGREIQLVDPAEVPDDAWTCSVFGMGSIAPAQTLGADERTRLGYGGWVVERPMAEAVRTLEAHAGRRIAALVAFELGAGNTPGPIDAGLRLAIPVVDGDYAGRAVPELTQVPPAVFGHSLCPCAICDPWGNRLLLLSTPSARLGERIGKLLSLATKLPDPAAPCAHAGFLLAGREMKRLVIAGTVSRALAVGRHIRQAREAGRDPAQAAAVALGGWVVFSGRVRAKEWESRDGYMFGTTTLAGEDRWAGRIATVWFQNENHLLRINGRPVASSPDLLMTMDRSSGEALTNALLEVGMSVAVIGAAADARYRTPEGLAVLGPQAIGLDLRYVPIEHSAKGGV